MNFKEIGEESTLVVDNDVDQPKKARKRIRNSAEWSSNVQKRLKYAAHRDNPIEEVKESFQEQLRNKSKPREIKEEEKAAALTDVLADKLCL
ncbi:hypothetical protein RRG08_064520 [Elysia crispata]|uniref:Uncharacterized protein n=1 Tax=Elysia crispata TaxID=231223 RepID=A0AAE1CU23_9GAST|nr:hypothetical protein RRG08_064520 [Elysia crispata]